MPISGYVAGGASEALEEVLDRRLKEQVRQAQEKQHAEQIAVQRQQIDLQQRRDEAMDLERQKDREWRQGERDIATAQRAEADTDPGAISPEIAAVLSKDPAIAGRISQRKVIDATPIANLQSVLPGAVAPEPAGAAGPRLIESLGPRAATPAAIGGPVSTTTDASGPQQYPVLGATPKQAKEAKMEADRNTYNDELSRASGEDAKRVIAAKAAREGIKLDPNLIAPSQSELRATTLQTQIAAEERANRENDRRSNRDEQDIRGRPSRGGLADLTPAGVSAVFKLQDDFARDSKPFTLIRDAYQKIVSASEKKGAVANMAMIFGFMKIVDPTSVVREGEYATAQNAGSVPTKLMNLYNKTVSGEFLTPEQNRQFVDVAHDIYETQRYNQQGVVDQYSNRAAQLGLPPQMVVTDLDNVSKKERETTVGRQDVAPSNVPQWEYDPKTQTYKQVTKGKS